MFFSVPKSQLHKNFLELKVVLMALKKFEHLSLETILIVTDNTTFDSYINKKAGMRSPECNCRQTFSSQAGDSNRMIFAFISFQLNSCCWHHPQTCLPPGSTTSCLILYPQSFIIFFVKWCESNEVDSVHHR